MFEKAQAEIKENVKRMEHEMIEIDRNIKAERERIRDNGTRINRVANKIKALEEEKEGLGQKILSQEHAKNLSRSNASKREWYEFSDMSAEE